MDSLFGLMGYVGIVFMLISYFLLVVGHMKVTDTPYILLNILGALFIVITLHTGGTLPILYTVVAWLLISVFGFYKHHLATTH